MAKARKRFVIAGNWKMNPDSAEAAKALFSALERKAKKAPKASVIICPPALFAPLLAKSAKKIALGVQDVDARERGAYTGSVSALQAKSIGASYSIVGHSERRAAGDTDDVVAEKSLRALEAGLKLILCVGERQRDANAEYLQAVRSQLLAVLEKVDKKHSSSIMIAYEPVWAIGKDAKAPLSPEGIHEMTIFIKKIVAERFGKAIGLKTPVLYGGSVNAENAEKMLSDGGMDGLLIGRQSLDAESLSNIIDYATKH